MIDRTTHIIRRQRLDVAFRDGRKGLGLPDELSELFRERIAPLLEMVLEEEDRPGYYVRLDRVVIDVGVLPSGQWEQVLPARVVKQFREELRRQLQALSMTTSGSGGDREELEQGEQGWEDGRGRCFMPSSHFLSTGTLTGVAEGVALGELERQVSASLLRQDQPAPPAWKKRLTDRLSEDPLCLERFLLQLGPELRYTVLQCWDMEITGCPLP